MVLGTVLGRRSVILAVLLALFFVPISGAGVVQAESSEISVPGRVYEFAKDSHYEFTTAYTSGVDTDDSSTFGDFAIVGDIDAAGDMNGVPAYQVNSGNVEFEYAFAEERLTVDESQWSIARDRTKSVDTIKLDDPIQSGALILQTSLDGETWILDQVLTDVFTEETPLTDTFYTTSDIQIQNGCYFRVIVAYQLFMKLDDRQILFVEVDNYTYSKIAEVYEFYAVSEELTALPTDTPRKELGSKTNTGKDNGFSGNQAIAEDDPHYGWDIGTFFVNGYTRETKDDDSKPVFLKNVGDKVTLWFNLAQDIDRLGGDDALSVAEDNNGYDQYFETDKTKFKRGALIIRFTDEQGVRHEPVIYTDYLAANAKTGADTRVQLFEEGDYEVALNYVIKNSPRQIGSLSVVPTYTNYRIFFEFSIRNGNCMVYPFDLGTGAELVNDAVTTSGFNLDMARSKYLTIDVTRSVFTTNRDGTKSEDVRFNRPAQDGEAYTEEGKYVFAVKNLYTGENTTKTIYVGEDSFFKLLSISGLSMQQVNDLLEAGAEIAEDGSLVLPTEPEPEVTEDESLKTEAPVEEPASEPVGESEGESVKGKADDPAGEPAGDPAEDPTGDSTVEAGKVDESSDGVSDATMPGLIQRWLPYVIAALFIIVLLVVFLWMRRKRSRPGSGDRGESER